jgi:antitoxin MazE
MQAQVLKWGNSLAVRIPKPVADDAHLQLGDPLEIAVAGDGVVQMHRVGEIAMRRSRSGRRSEGKPSNGEPVRSRYWRHCLPGL